MLKASWALQCACGRCGCGCRTLLLLLLVSFTRSPPNIYFKKKKTGGVSINSTLPLTRMDEKLIQRVLQEYKIHNCEVSRQAGHVGRQV